MARRIVFSILGGIAITGLLVMALLALIEVSAFFVSTFGTINALYGGLFLIAVIVISIGLYHTTFAEKPTGGGSVPY